MTRLLRTPKRQQQVDGAQPCRAVLVLGTADWDQPIATNQHYAVRELAKSFDVVFVESMGLRQPRLSLRDVQRVLRRLLRSRRAGSTIERREVPPGVTVVSPLVIPVHRGLPAWVNHVLIRWCLGGLSTLQPPIGLLAYTPTTYGLERRFSISLYHCVDLLGEVPGVSMAVVRRWEESLGRRGVTAAASSQAVEASLRGRGFSEVLNWPNVADSEFFGAFHSAQRRPSSVCFAGNLTPLKVDFDLLADLVGVGLEVHLAGPLSEGGTSSRHLVDALVARGAHYHGHLNPEQLATLMGTCIVGLAPYVVNNYTLGINPLKVYEHLAAGNALVSTAIPAVESREGHVVVAPDRASFVAEAARLAARPITSSDIAMRRRIADAHSWRTRGRELRAYFGAGDD